MPAAETRWLRRPTRALFVRGVQHRMDKLAAERESFLPHSAWTKTGQRALSTRKYTQRYYFCAPIIAFGIGFFRSES